MSRRVFDFFDRDNGDTWVVNIPENHGSGADHSLPEPLRRSELDAKQTFVDTETADLTEEKEAFKAITDTQYTEWVATTYRKLSEIGERIGTGTPFHRDRIMREFWATYSLSDECNATIKHLFQVDSPNSKHRYIVMKAFIRIRDHYFSSAGLCQAEPDQAAIRYRLSKAVAQCIHGEIQKMKDVKGNGKQAMPKRRKRLIEMLQRHIHYSLSNVKANSRFPQSFATLERQQEQFGLPLAVVDDDIFEVFLQNDKRIFQILSTNCLNVSDHTPFVELVNEVTGDLNMTDMRIRLPGIDINIIDKLFRRYVKILVQDLGGDVVRRRTVEDSQEDSDDLSFPAFLVALNQRLDVVSALLGNDSGPPSPDRERNASPSPASSPSRSPSAKERLDDARAVREASPQPSTSGGSQSNSRPPSVKRKHEDTSMHPTSPQPSTSRGQLNLLTSSVKRQRLDTGVNMQTKSPQPSTSKENHSNFPVSPMKTGEGNDLGLASPELSGSVETPSSSMRASTQEDRVACSMMTLPDAEASTTKETEEASALPPDGSDVLSPQEDIC